MSENIDLRLVHRRFCFSLLNSLSIINWYMKQELPRCMLIYLQFAVTQISLLRNYKTSGKNVLFDSYVISAAFQLRDKDRCWNLLLKIFWSMLIRVTFLKSNIKNQTIRWTIQRPQAAPVRLRFEINSGHSIIINWALQGYQSYCGNDRNVVFNNKPLPLCDVLSLLRKLPVSAGCRG